MHCDLSDEILIGVYFYVNLHSFQNFGKATIYAQRDIVASILLELTDVKKLTNAKMKMFVARIPTVSIPMDHIIALAELVMKD